MKRNHRDRKASNDERNCGCEYQDLAQKIGLHDFVWVHRHISILTPRKGAMMNHNCPLTTGKWVLDAHMPDELACESGAEACQNAG